MQPSVAAVMAVFFVIAFSSHVSAESVAERFQRTARAMACPGAPSVEQINLNGHRFNANKDMWISGSRVKGHFNHHRSSQPDDDIDFSFSKDRGPGGVEPDPLEDVRVEVNLGGFYGWVDDLIDGTIGSFFGLIDIQPDEVLEPHVEVMVDELAGKGWREQAVGVVLIARAHWIINAENPSRGICNECTNGQTKQNGCSADETGIGYTYLCVNGYWKAAGGWCEPKAPPGGQQP